MQYLLKKLSLTPFPSGRALVENLHLKKGSWDGLNIPLGRFGTAEDIANVTLFLASGMSNYVTGQTISVCGGLNM